MHRSTTTIVLSTLVLAVPAMAWTPNPEGLPDGGDWIPELHGGEIPWVPEDGLPELPDGGLPELPEFGDEVFEFLGGWELPELWAPCRIDVPEDYVTIQAAVDAADNGCLIVLAEGVYYENDHLGDSASSCW